MTSELLAASKGPNPPHQTRHVNERKHSSPFQICAPLPEAILDLISGPMCSSSCPALRRRGPSVGVPDLKAVQLEACVMCNRESTP